MNIEDLPENSDSSDEDYIPDTSNVNLPSEEDSDGSVEFPVLEAEELSSTRSRKPKKVIKSKKKRKNKSPSPITKTIEKQSTDDLWADFKKDTGFKTRAERLLNTETVVCNNKSPTISESDRNEIYPKVASTHLSKSVNVTEIYNFAGEDVKVEKKINVSSDSRMPVKRGAKGGINSVLNSITKKTKISTLDKSKLDWDKFKKEENIEDELHAYSKSKNGYLEKQDFLQRADVRRFEIEKDLRSSLRSNRMNNLK